VTRASRRQSAAALRNSSERSVMVRQITHRRTVNNEIGRLFRPAVVIMTLSFGNQDRWVCDDPHIFVDLLWPRSARGFFCEGRACRTD
jgi:hypothetical protein